MRDKAEQAWARRWRGAGGIVNGIAALPAAAPEPAAGKNGPVGRGFRAVPGRGKGRERENDGQNPGSG
ncbi:MAG TPA: hypothetical protein DEA73_06135 [Peptococcaceae bacterium]|nr:hypothetical protein [Peptococcaceae bacterium]